jgi:hypothetical protein
VLYRIKKPVDELRVLFSQGCYTSHELFGIPRYPRVRQEELERLEPEKVATKSVKAPKKTTEVDVPLYWDHARLPPKSCSGIRKRTTKYRNGVIHSTWVSVQYFLAHEGPSVDLLSKRGWYCASALV